jgi:hypothetical protein
MERIDLSDHCAEVYEHYAVTSWFAGKLRWAGETVREFAGYDIWCRTCTGQSTWMVCCFTKIAKDMKILPGMENDWTKNE